MFAFENCRMNRHLFSDLLPSALALMLACCAGSAPAAEAPLTIAVMDPLAAPLACACVRGHAQRQYEKLAEHLQAELKRPFKAVFGEDLGRLVQDPESGPIALVVGKQSVVRFDAAKLRLAIRPLAMLTGRDGKTTLRGLFVVPRNDPARVLSDLQGYKILFGPIEADEKHSAAMEALKRAGVAAPQPVEVTPGCSDGALAVQENKSAVKMATVISTYAMPLLEGCGTVDKGSLRIVGQTAEVPFITVYATDRCGADLEAPLRKTLLAVGKSRELLTALESRDGFVPIENGK